MPPTPNYRYVSFQGIESVKWSGNSECFRGSVSQDNLRSTRSSVEPGLTFIARLISDDLPLFNLSCMGQPMERASISVPSPAYLLDIQVGL